jgi:hypothetical protein
MFGWKHLSRTLGRSARAADTGKRCGSCLHFRNDPLYLEAEIPGLTSLSSGSASVRADDGLCHVRGRFVGERFSCGEHAAREG